MRQRLTWQAPVMEKLASKPILTKIKANQALVGADLVNHIRREYEDQIAEGVPRNGFTLMTDDSGSGDITFQQQQGDWIVSWNLSSRSAINLLNHVGSWGEQRLAAVATGLYGFRKAVQRDVDSATSKLQKRAGAIARRIYGADEDVVGFLQRHAKTGKSKSAKMLLEAMKDIGPKLASKKEAGVSPKGLYGFKHKTAELGMNACSELRLAAGQIVADLHERRGDGFGDIYAYMQRHSKEGRCMYAGMLVACGPDMPVATEEIIPKIASRSVQEWLDWDGNE